MIVTHTRQKDALYPGTRQTAFFEKVGVSLGPGPSASAVYGRGTYPVVC